MIANETVKFGLGKALPEYVLVTPARNEEMFLPLVADSVIKQTLKPKMWLIVDDGSTDNTPQIIQDLERDFEWVKSVRLPPHPRDLFYHYSFVCKSGFEHAMDLAKKNDVNYAYIGLVDADTVLDPRYFELLVGKFIKDNTLGIASGNIYDLDNGQIKENTEGYLPRGTGRLWTEKCFLETEGYIVEAAAHSISNVKAILRGYSIKKFDDIIAVQQRPTRSAEGMWKTYAKDGWLAYYLNKHPLLVLLNVIQFSIRKPFYLGIPYLFGYMRSVFSRCQKINDDEVRDYYWNARLREYKSRLGSKMKAIFIK